MQRVARIALTGAVLAPRLQYHILTGRVSQVRSNQGVTKLMKKLALLFCAVFVVAGVASAAQATAPAKPAATAKTHIVEAEVVSADATAQTLTIKGEPNKTMPVDATATSHLKDLKAGEKVKLTCRDDAKGDHEAITHIVVEKAPAKK
jgi:hypothetical protein